MTFCTRLRAGAVTALAALAAAMVGGCGTDPAGPAGGSPREGGAITVLGPAFPDFLDPALNYSQDGIAALTQVYPGLMVFPHLSGPAASRVEPGLADGMPNISADGRTYTFRLRSGLRFSDGRPLRAS